MLIHPQNFSFIATEQQLTGGTAQEALSASWTDLQNVDYWQLDGKADNFINSLFSDKLGD